MPASSTLHSPKFESLAPFGEIASRMAHEIRNPLNAMRMQVAVIRHKLRQPDAANLAVASTQLARLEEEVLRVEKLAKTFLELSRPTQGVPQLIEVEPLVNEVAALFRPTLEALGVQFQVQAAARPPQRVFMDREKLRQVLLNLLENARGAVKAGDQISLRLSGVDDRIVIQVQDTGFAILADELPKIFLPFYSRNGNGLGLAVVKQIVEAAGGVVTVASEGPRETCFEVHLPPADESLASVGR